jgi:hypothetical protein
VATITSFSEINEEKQKVSTQVAGIGVQIPNRDFKIRNRHAGYLITKFDLEVNELHQEFATAGRK